MIFPVGIPHESRRAQNPKSTIHLLSFPSGRAAPQATSSALTNLSTKRIAFNPKAEKKAIKRDNLQSSRVRIYKKNRVSRHALYSADTSNTTDPTTHRMDALEMILSRVESDDPTLTELRLSSFTSETGFHYDLARLGNAIGGNTNLDTLIIDIFDVTRALEDMATNNGFLTGLKCNDSIYRLQLVDLDVSGWVGHEVLNGFVANISNLEQIILYYCDLGNG